MKHSNQLYGVITVLGILFQAYLLSIIPQNNIAGAMTTYGVTITKATFNTVSGNNSVINLSIINTDSSSFVISTVKVNGESCAIAEGNVTFETGASGSVVILLTSDNYWVTGDICKMDLYDSSRKLVGSYQAIAAPTIEPTPTPNPEPFPTTLILASIAIVVVALGILVCFKKYRK